MKIVNATSHFKPSSIITGVVAKLKTIIGRIDAACQKQYMKNSSREWREMLTNALNELVTIQ